jgi:polyisoprenoid-binding protein YceI
MMKKIALVAALSALSFSSFAASETFDIDSTHTAPRFEYNHMGFSTQLHRFDKTSGKITLDRAAKTAAVDVSIDAKSVNTGWDVFNGHLQGEDFFNVAKYPTITYKSSAVKFDGDKPASIEGNLTIKGITKPVTLTVTNYVLQPNGMVKRDAIGAVAVAKIKRSDFGLAAYVPYVSDEVTLTLVVEAIKSN